MIIVLGLSPAVDVTYELDKLEIGKTNRVRKVHQVAGGKSINVAKVATILGGQAHLIVPLGGMRGQWISEQLKVMGMSHTEIPIALETRQALTIYDGLATVINEAATTIGAHELVALKKATLEIFDSQPNSAESQAHSVFVITGSIPAGVPIDFINDLVSAAANRGIRSIVDVSGPAMLAIASSQPFLMKPNIDEITEATGALDVRDAVARLQTMGAKNILVSLGSEGASWFDETGQSTGAKAIQGVKGNPTGAGDAMVAAVCVGLTTGKTKDEILLDAISSGAAAVLSPVAGEITLENFESLRKKAELI